MIHYRMEYPGDPPADVYEMSREEFQKQFRPSQFTISSAQGTETVPVGIEEINCDLCNADPGLTIYVLIYGRRGCRAYCSSCFHGGIAKYCTKIEEKP